MKGIGGALAAEAGMKQQTFVVVHEQPVSDLVLDDQGGQQINVRTDGKSPTLRAEMHGNVPCVMAKTWDARGNGDGETVSTITGDHERRPTDYSSVVVEPCYSLQGNTIDRNAKQNGNGICEGVSHTLNAVDRHGVAYEQPIVFDKEVYNSGINASGGHYIAEGGPAPCLRTEHPPGVSYGVDCRNATEYPEYVGAIQASMNHNLNSNGVVRVRYIVRRLTPTECARLQGFPDKWGHPDKKEDFTEEEYRFWLEVRNTHAAINDKAVKEYTKEQMLTWYNKLHTDSSEYKLWGNGIALPNALYCMQGIADVLL